MSDKPDKVSVCIKPGIAARPLSAASDVGRAVLINGGLAFAVHDKDAESGLMLVARVVDKFVTRPYTGASVIILMGKFEFAPDMSGAVNAVAPDFYSQSLFLDGGDPYLVVQTPKDKEPHAFCMLNVKNATLYPAISRPLYAFPYWTFSSREADGTVAPLLSVGKDEVSLANTRALGNRSMWNK